MACLLSEVRGRCQDEPRDDKISQFKDVCLLKLLSYTLLYSACSPEVADPASELQLSILELCLRSVLLTAGVTSLQLYF